MGYNWLDKISGKDKVKARIKAIEDAEKRATSLRDGEDVQKTLDALDDLQKKRLELMTYAKKRFSGGTDEYTVGVPKSIRLLNMGGENEAMESFFERNEKKIQDLAKEKRFLRERSKKRGPNSIKDLRRIQQEKAKEE